MAQIINVEKFLTSIDEYDSIMRYKLYLFEQMKNFSIYDDNLRIIIEKSTSSVELNSCAIKLDEYISLKEKKMKVGFIGLGKLGLPVALSIESKGHEVFGYDTNESVKGYIENRKIPYQEIFADDLLQKTNMKFLQPSEVVNNADIIFVPVQTPHDPMYEGITRIPNDRVDFNYDALVSAMRTISDEVENQDNEKIVVIISTVLPGTIEKYIKPFLSKKIKLCYNPFFIAMGTTVRDFLSPEFVLLGVDDEEASKKVQGFYFTLHDKPVYKTSVKNAELIKVSYNTFIGMKIVFANTVMEICHKIGANVDSVIDALSLANERLISPKYLRGGMGDGGGCLLPDGLIYTDNGIKKIKDIKIGENVLTHDGSYRKVIDTYKRPYDGKILKVSARGLGYEFFTEEHPFLVVKDTRRKYITSGITKTVNNKSFSENISSVEEIRCDQLTKNHYMMFPENIKYEKAENLDNQLPNYIELAGYYISEGSIWKDKNRNFSMRRIEFHFHEKETIYHNRVISLVKNLYPHSNPTIINHDGSKGISIRINNSDLTNRLNNDFGSGAFDKRIPKWIFDNSIDNIKLFLSGIFRGDGYNSKTGGGVSLSTVSYKIAYGVYLLLKKCNIKSTVQKYKKRTGKDGITHNESYEVRIRNANYINDICNIVGWNNTHKMQNKRYNTLPSHNGNTYHKITSIESFDYIGDVYNLNVDVNHTYVTKIGSVHNCHPRDNIAMSWLARELKLSHDFFDDLMMAREDQTEWMAKLCLEQGDLPIAILGKSFKPETNLTTGSPSILLYNILNEKKNVEIYDPISDGIESFENNAKHIIGSEKKYLYFIGTQHSYFKDFKFNKDSVVIDPFRYIPETEYTKENNIKIISIGNGK